jgi:hypothetical protein
VPALDQDIRRHPCHDRQDGRVVKDGDMVHGSQGSEDLGAFRFRLKSPAISLESAETAITVHGDNENIAQTTRLGKQACMARMEQIEASVGQDDPPTISFKLVDLEIGLVEGQDLWGAHEVIPLFERSTGWRWLVTFQSGFREAETTPAIGTPSNRDLTYAIYTGDEQVGSINAWLRPPYAECKRDPVGCQNSIVLGNRRAGASLETLTDSGKRR